MTDFSLPIPSESTMSFATESTMEDTSVDTESDICVDPIPKKNHVAPNHLSKRSESSPSSYTNTASESCSESNAKSRKFKEKQKSVFTNFPKLDTKDWYTHSSFNRYWQHYNYVMDWYSKHRHTYTSLQQKLGLSHSVHSHMYASPTHYAHAPRHVCPQQVHSNLARVKTHVNDTVRGGKQASNSKKRKQQDVDMVNIEDKVLSASVSVRSHDDTADVDDEDVASASLAEAFEIEMDISDEMLDFFAETQRHQKKREAEKKAEKAKEKEEKRINIEEVKSQTRERTSEAPKERPGSRRTAEMKFLYGKGAAMIHGMETALQMTYDRNLDIKQPKHWPNMPFNIIFS